MIPDLAAKFRLARIVGVEFPFGHAFGMPNDRTMQRRVASAALRLLAEATAPESRLDVDIQWPVDQATAYRDWQPDEPSPIVAFNLRRRQELEGRREGGASA